MNFSRLPLIPSQERLLFDTNIFVYSALDHPVYGESCSQAFHRVESGVLEGYVPLIVLTELLHRLMLAEVIKKEYARNTRDALELLKEDKSIIPSLTICWDELERIYAAGFIILEDRTGIFKDILLVSRRYSLLSNDACIASFARAYRIPNIATNDPDFERVDWLTVWKP